MPPFLTHLFIVPVVAFITLSVLPGTAQTIVLTEAQLQKVDTALLAMNMDRSDAGFNKDVGDCEMVWPPLRGLLADPFALPSLASNVLTQLEAGSYHKTVHALLADSNAVPPSAVKDMAISLPPKTKNALKELDPALARALNPFLLTLLSIDAEIEATYGSASNEHAYLLAHEIYGSYHGRSHEQVTQLLKELGVPDAVFVQLAKERNTLDPEPAAMRRLASVDPPASGKSATPVGSMPTILYRYGAWLEQLDAATDELLKAVATVTNWPAKAQVIECALPNRPKQPYRIIIGSTGTDSYTEHALLIVDPAGDDRYVEQAGIANGLLGRRSCHIIDLAGDDRYLSTEIVGPGTAICGLQMIRDEAGHDMYHMAGMGQASAILGAALLDDRSGDDTYRARFHAQASALYGIALLRDHAGRDRYDVGLCGQAYSGVHGLSMLLDVTGDDAYHAGGVVKDTGRYGEQTLSLAQGFAIGDRPFAGGGTAVLMDLAGNDDYKADVYGQGVSYWYSLGMLYDRSGNDTYLIYHYGQGSGIHLSTGLLLDQQGRDQYTSVDGLSQGNAHDYAVGMLIDHQGMDKYSADHFSQGRGMNNSFALLFDDQGHDMYSSRLLNRSQGIGDDGRTREYGSISMIVDGQGIDRYSVDLKDGQVKRRPNHGVIYDFPEPPPKVTK